MGKSLQDLGLKPETVGGADFDNLPEQMGNYVPPPQPGTYRFQLPASLKSVWDTLTTKENKTRVKAGFDADNPLVIVQSPGNTHTGEAFRTTLTNVERNRARRGEPEVLVSDMDYLLKALGESKRPATNEGYITTMLSKAGKSFQADVTWSWSCNPERTIYVEDGQGGTIEDPSRKGCGARYYQRDVPKDAEGKFPLRITCGQCGASVRAFPNLGNFQP